MGTWEASDRDIGLILFCFVLFCFVLLLRAMPTAYGGSQARG